MAQQASNQRHTVRQGDTLISIAARYGYRNWQTIWNHDGNQALRDLRDDPQVLEPGDRVFIPAKKPLQHECELNKRHTFTLPVPKAYLRLRMQDGSGEIYGGKKFELTVEDETLEGKTKSNGMLIQEIPRHAKKATLKLWATDEGDPLEWTLNIGHMNPGTSDVGIQGRLNNLGYYSGEVDGRVDEAFRDAIRQFQAANDLPTTGSLDDKTRAKILAVYRAKQEATASS